MRPHPHAPTPPQSNSGSTQTLTPAAMDWPTWAPTTLASRTSQNALGPSRKIQENQGECQQWRMVRRHHAQTPTAQHRHSQPKPGAGAPDHRTPAEAKCSHDRPPWDKPTPKSPTRKACTVAQGPCQTGSVDTDNPDQSDHGGHAIHPLQPAHIDATFLCHQLAIFQSFPISVDHQVRPLTDPAPASAAVCTIACDVPHCEAVNTLTRAASPIRPATTFAHANSSTAVDWRATPGHAFSIDGGTMPPFSRRLL